MLVCLKLVVWSLFILLERLQRQTAEQRDEKGGTEGVLINYYLKTNHRHFDVEYSHLFFKPSDLFSFLLQKGSTYSYILKKLVEMFDIKKQTNK